MKDKEFVIEQNFVISTTIRALGFSLQNDFIKKQRTMGLALVVGSSKNGLKLKTPTRDINLS